jgi:hypothetical protein
MKKLGFRCAALLVPLVSGQPASAQVPLFPATDKQPPILAELEEPPLFGESNGLIFLRDRRDLIRLYPHAELGLEAHGFWGERVEQLSSDQARVDLGPRFFVRHARFELGGELGKRLAFDAALELRANPAIDGARDDARDPAVALDDAWGYLNAGRGLGLMIGYFQAPFSLENSSKVTDLAFMERNIAVRGFAMPAPKSLGAVFTGSTYPGGFDWTAGAFGAEALTPGDPDRAFDLMARVGIEPWVTHQDKGHLRGARFGLSARFGTRNPRDTDSDAPAITTRQGFALWRPSHLDSLGQTVHVKQTGYSWALGVEARVPTRRLTLRSEAFLVSRDVREGLAGAPLNANDRLGRLRGFSGYIELSTWPLMLFDILETEQPKLGHYPEPEHLELGASKPYQDRYGAELAIVAGGILAKYDPVARVEGGTADAGAPGGDIRVIELGAAATYWHTSRFKLSVSYNAYLTPGSGGSENLAGVPANLEPGAKSDVHLFEELGARVTLMF